MNPGNRPIPRPGCRDPLPMTPAKIIAIARKRGEFWAARREKPLLRACRKLCEAGHLSQLSETPKHIIFRAESPSESQP